MQPKRAAAKRLANAEQETPRADRVIRSSLCPKPQKSRLARRKSPGLKFRARSFNGPGLRVNQADLSKTVLRGCKQRARAPRLRRPPMSEAPLDERVETFLTPRDWLRYAVGRFLSAGLAFGHGATTALDEAAFSSSRA